MKPNENIVKLSVANSPDVVPGAKAIIPAAIIAPMVTSTVATIGVWNLSLTDATLSGRILSKAHANMYLVCDISSGGNSKKIGKKRATNITVKSAGLLLTPRARRTV